MKQIVRFLPVILYSAMIFYLSAQSQPMSPDLGFEMQDKVYHCGAYFIYGMLLIIALSSKFDLANSKRLMIYVLGIGGLFALSDEVHQYFVPGRSAEVWDWLADVVGLYISVWLVQYNLKKFTKGNGTPNE
ncbi:MAG: VanZ family protein [Candidatus Kapabacteria bacterium]|nr:VanZ family protein [Candidatus Kapabacteria bacterium]MBX7154807.1 VanZ family protein [Bacteroidota bacterium]